VSSPSLPAGGLGEFKRKGPLIPRIFWEKAPKDGHEGSFWIRHAGRGVFYCISNLRDPGSVVLSNTGGLVSEDSRTIPETKKKLPVS
jgi:hypothetical protein